MGDDDSPTPQTTPSLADLYREIDRLSRELEESERARERLKRQNERLKKELEAARRAAKRQAAPFSKGVPTPHPKAPGRRVGRHHGRHGHRQPPPQIDETIYVPLPASCPGCGGTLTGSRVADQIQEELPVVRPHVRRFRVHIGHCATAVGACSGGIPCRPPMRSTRRVRTWEDDQGRRS